MYYYNYVVISVMFNNINSNCNIIYTHSPVDCLSIPPLSGTPGTPALRATGRYDFSHLQMKSRLSTLGLNQSPRLGSPHRPAQDSTSLEPKRPARRCRPGHRFGHRFGHTTAARSAVREGVGACEETLCAEPSALPLSSWAARLRAKGAGSITSQPAEWPRAPGMPTLGAAAEGNRFAPQTLSHIWLFDHRHQSFTHKVTLCVSTCQAPGSRREGRRPLDFQAALKECLPHVPG